MWAKRCCECRIAQDTFDRADSDSLGPDWTELTGDADIVSNQLKFVTDGIVKHNTPHPDGETGKFRVQAKVKFASQGSGVYARVLAGLVDGTHWVSASLHAEAAGCWTLRLTYDGDLGGPSLTYVTRIADADVNGEHTLELCWVKGAYPTHLFVWRAKLTLSDGRVYGVQNCAAGADPCETWYCTGGGAYAGLAGSADTTLDDFYFGHMKEEGTCKDVCPDCNTPCFVESDNFNRSDNDDPGCKWEEGAADGGDWDIVSNELKLVTAGTGSQVPCIVLQVPHPQCKTAHYVTADVYVASGLKPRVAVNMTNGSSPDYHWAKLEVTGGSASTLTLTIGKRVGGTDTTLATGTATSSADRFYQLIVCMDDFGVLTAIISEVGLNVAAVSTPIGGGTHVGLAAETGGERFDNFRFEKHFSIDGDTECPNCQERPCNCDNAGQAILPQWIVAVLQNFGNGADPPACSDCNKVNRGYLYECIGNSSVGLCCSYDTNDPGESLTCPNSLTGQGAAVDTWDLVPAGEGLTVCPHGDCGGDVRVSLSMIGRANINLGSAEFSQWLLFTRCLTATEWNQAIFSEEGVRLTTYTTDPLNDDLVCSVGEVVLYAA